MKQGSWTNVPDNVYILVKTSNRTLYIHEYNGIQGYEFQSLAASEPIHTIL